MLRDRRFALLLATRALSVLGGAFAPVALAFGVLGLPGATASTLSIVLAAEEIPLVLFMLVGGVIAFVFGVSAERKSLESITSPLSVVPPGKGGGGGRS